MRWMKADRCHCYMSDYSSRSLWLVYRVLCIMPRVSGEPHTAIRMHP